jgi:hypothetical protein
MAVAALQCSTLHLLPGVAEDFGDQIKRLVEDCKSRPAIDKPRILKVELRISPHPQDANDVSIEPILTTKSPARRHDPIRARCSRTNQLQFDFVSDDDSG